MQLNKTSDRTRAAYCFGTLSFLVALAHCLFYTLADIESSYEFGSQAWFYFLLYLLILNTPLIFFAYLTRQSSTGFGATEPLTSGGQLLDVIERYALVLFVVAVVGVLLHWKAKLNLLPGDFNGCWSYLRSSWLNTSVRDAMSFSQRLESVLGHLLSSPLYLGLFASSASIARYGLGWRRLFFFVAFSLIGFAYALAIVSRSVVLLLVVVVILGCAFPFLLGDTRFADWIKRTFIVGSTFGGLSFLLALGIFANSINCDAISAKSATANVMSYENGFFDELPIKRSDHPNFFQRKTRELCGVCNTVFLYLNHGMYNFSEVLSTRQRGDPVTFKFLTYWAQRLKLIDKPEKVSSFRVYGQGGATLPGSAYHDYGTWGVVFVAFCHGLLLLISFELFRKRSAMSLVGLALYVAGGISLATSGLFVGPSLMGFPFAIFSILAWGTLVLLLDFFSSLQRTRRLARPVD